jgi:tyrosyl-tRNA synthetase
MSKSLGNYVGVNEDPASMFGKIMSISDEVMWEYFRLLTDQDVEKIKLIHPKEAKLSLAQTISAFYHGQENAAQAREQFQRIFSEKKLPDDILVYKATSPKVDLLEIFTQTKLTASKNEARRLFTQEGVSLVDENYNLTVLTEQIIEIPSQGIILKLGKRKFIKIVYPE